jgi:alkyl hydroperoxide reductase subunit AhpC
MQESIHEHKQPQIAQPSVLAPLFSAEAYHKLENKITTIQLAGFKGKWTVLFFYPSNFTFV